MLPCVIENLIAQFAWGVKFKLKSELDTLIKFRECIPLCWISVHVQWKDSHRYGKCLNPWHPMLPYTPLRLIKNNPPFKNGMLEMPNHMCQAFFRIIGTYRKVFQRYLIRFFLGDMSAWNKIFQHLINLQSQIDALNEDFLYPETLLDSLLIELESAELLPPDFTVPWSNNTEYVVQLFGSSFAT